MPRASRSFRTSRYACSDAARAPSPGPSAEPISTTCGGPDSPESNIPSKSTSRRNAAQEGIPSDRIRSSPRNRSRRSHSGSRRLRERLRTNPSEGPGPIGTTPPGSSVSRVRGTSAEVISLQGHDLLLRLEGGFERVPWKARALDPDRKLGDAREDRELAQGLRVNGVAGAPGHHTVELLEQVVRLSP